ncbi:MAG: transcriptional regulator [Acidimicrobiales bacterium]
MTIRVSEELLGRVRATAAGHGRSMNDYVSAVLGAATDPDLAGDEAARVRERLAQAGLLVVTNPRGRRPPTRRVTEARAAAGRGTPLSQLVQSGRR